ncbi:MAG TPA: C1 family peptidase, partial [Chitinophagaceae bacterium]
KETINGYQDTDGCPDTAPAPSPTDTDGDGIADGADACPTQKETFNGYQDADGCPDTVPDTDGDGIIDTQDGCINEKETVNGYQDEDGCPDTEPVVLPPTTLPANYFLTMPPVQNQGSEFSCVALATATTRSVEYFYKTNATSYNTSINVFSPEYLYNQAKYSSDCYSGTDIYSCLNLIKNQGICTWQSMPYSSTNGCSQLPTTAQTSEAGNYKINTFSLVYQYDQAAIKTLLSQNHPLIAGTSIDNTFSSATTGFIWKTFQGSYGTNHAYVICGYDDAKHAYKVMNSWGTSWGENGYSWIDYDFFGTLPGSVYVINY